MENLSSINPLWIIITVAIILIIVLASKYNGMIRWKNILKQAFADIDVQLKQRFDLIPNLIEAVKGYTKHEKETLESLTKARTAFLGAGSRNDKIEADNMLSGALKSIFAVAENYPDLKANTTFLKLQDELADVENKIAAARRFFNNSVQEYNTYIQIFPNNIIAGIFWFKNEKSFEVSDKAERKNVKVSFE